LEKAFSIVLLDVQTVYTQLRFPIYGDIHQIEHNVGTKLTGKLFVSSQSVNVRTMLVLPRVLHIIWLWKFDAGITHGVIHRY